MRTPNEFQRAARRLAFVAAFIAPAVAGAQKTTLDRTKVPPPGPLPRLEVPTWTTMQLADGATLIVSEKHDLPLVSFTISWSGGADQYEPAGKTGLANMVASMLSEGTTTRTGDQLSEALQMLGTTINTGVGGEAGQMGFVSMKDKFAPTLAILEDELMNPTFPEAALERLRARTLVGLQQSRDRTAYVASQVFRRTLYGDEHPYGRFTTEASIKSITRDDVVGFHKAYFTPNHAYITVVGDITPAQARATVEKELAAWTGSGAAPSFNYPAVPAPKATTIYLVDKPGAAQSSFAIGLAGPARNTPDYYAIELMNTILGGMFQSRLNADIREQKGYSYGVSSRFAYGHGPGAFQAGGEIVTAKTDSALLEFVKHLKGIRGDIPVTDEELATAKSKLIQQLPDRFESVESTAGSITGLYLDGLPKDYYQKYQENVQDVTKADLQRVANQYLDPAHMAIVIVGDRKTIETPLRALNIAPVSILDVDGNPAATPVTP
jgi:predicted Zn-dependent peptidase